jgi:hypothetical protein
MLSLPAVSADPGPQLRGRSAGPVARWWWLGAAAVTALAGVTGWLVAGPPADGAGTVPPPCPASLPADPLALGRGGVADRLVPVPLPQPRGPVAVRICSYPAGAAGTAPYRSAVLDPPRTAELAGVLNDSGPGVATTAVTGRPRPPGCPSGGPVILLLFRYTQGEPLVAMVDGGLCALVSTSARAEAGRVDVTQILARSLT